MQSHHGLPHPLSAWQLHIDLANPKLRAFINPPSPERPPWPRFVAPRTIHPADVSARPTAARNALHTATVPRHREEDRPVLLTIQRSVDYAQLRIQRRILACSAKRSHEGQPHFPLQPLK